MDYILNTFYWSFLPPLAAQGIHTLWYRSGLRGSSIPQKGSPDFASDYRKCYLLGMTLYLLYSILKIEWDMPLNYYRILNVPLGVEEKNLRTTFKQLSLLYHPDKLKGNPNAERNFIAMRNAYEVLKDPSKRLIYNVFGGGSKGGCEKCILFKEFFMNNLGSTFGFYGMTLLMGILFGVLLGGSLSFAPYWRLTTFISLLSFELSLLVSTSDPFPFLLHWHTQYEKIDMARQLFMVFSIAMNIIGPALFPEDKRTKEQLTEELETLLFHDLHLAQVNLKNSVAPLTANGAGLGALRTRMERLYVENALEADAEFRLIRQQLQS